MVFRMHVAVVAALAVAAVSASGAPAARPDCIVSAQLTTSPQHVLVTGTCTAASSSIALALPSRGVRAGRIITSPYDPGRACRADAAALACTRRVGAGHNFRVDVTSARPCRGGEPLRFTVHFASGRTLTLHLEVLALPGD